MIDRIKSARPHDAPPIVVLNMMGVPKRPEIPLKDFGEAIGIEPAVVVPFDPHLFGMAANNGQMVGEVQPQSKTAIAIEALAASLCGRQPAPKKTKAASLLERLPPILKR
jgi:pilus assembly protein CpaE